MLDKIENSLRKEGRQQRGRKVLKSRRNIIGKRENIRIYLKEERIISLDQFKIIRLDLSKLFPSSEFLFRILPNKSFSKKGLLVRMGKGKGKIDSFGTILAEGTILIEIINDRGEKDVKVLNSFFKKHPFLAYKFG